MHEELWMRWVSQYNARDKSRMKDEGWEELSELVNIIPEMKGTAKEKLKGV